MPLLSWCPVPSQCPSVFHCILFPQSFLMVLIDDRHLGHLWVVDLNLSRQKGMRQQPATHLQEEEQEQNEMEACRKRPIKLLYAHANYWPGWRGRGVSYPIKAVMIHTNQVTLLTEVKVSVTMNCRHSGHCVLHGHGGSLSTSRITVGAVERRNTRVVVITLKIL